MILGKITQAKNQALANILEETEKENKKLREENMKLKQEKEDYLKSIEMKDDDIEFSQDNLSAYLDLEKSFMSSTQVSQQQEEKVETISTKIDNKPRIKRIKQENLKKQAQ